MLHSYFYHDVLRKYVIGFGLLFNDIHVVRTDSLGDENHRQRVPLTYANKEKFWTRLREDRDGHRKIAVKLPQLGFEHSEPIYSSERKTMQMHKLRATTDNGTRMMFNAVPYDIPFTLHCAAKSVDEKNQILEQILPFFTPTRVVTIKPITGWSDFCVDIPISFSSIAFTDEYEGTFEDRRQLGFSIEFTLKGYIFAPEKVGKRIENVDINFRHLVNGGIMEAVNTVPTHETKAVSDIDPDVDDFGYLHTITSNVQ